MTCITVTLDGNLTHTELVWTIAKYLRCLAVGDMVVFSRLSCDSTFCMLEVNYEPDYLYTVQYTTLDADGFSIAHSHRTMSDHAMSYMIAGKLLPFVA